MLYLVSYDIPDDRRRIKLAKTLKDFGDRVQYSVFECLLDRELLEEMEARIVKIIDEKEDSIRVYSLCAGCEKVIAIFGQGEVSHEEEVCIL